MRPKLLNYRFSLVLLILNFITLITFSQSNTDFQHDIKKIVPPSPNASSLGKYGQIPVNMNSGMPEISIPLYEISGQDLAVPISLSYHGGGFRVAEVASSVGLGWSLNAGGVISRSVRGWPDESTRGYYNTMVYYNQNIKGTASTCIDTYDPNSPTHCNWKVAASKGEYDFEPDEFSFNFNGYSGRIIFNENKVPIFSPFQNLKIEGSILSDWRIITPDGTIYYFEKKEITNFRYGGNYVSAWYLTEITSIKNDETIYLTYTDNGNNWQESLSSRPRVVSLEPIIRDTDPRMDNVCVNGTEFETEVESTGTVQLNSIQFPKYGVNAVFKYADDRSDIGFSTSLQRLTQIAIIKTDTLQKFTLNNNSYFEGINNFNESAYLCKRLKLTSLKNNTNNTNHSFEYFEDYQMPSYESADIDHWGYFNNANNGSFIPTMPPRYKGFYIENSWLTANKETDPNAVKACVLKKITYPTGGYSQFNWEANVVSFENQSETISKNATISCANTQTSMTNQEINFANNLHSLYSDDPNMPVNLKIVPFVKKESGRIAVTVNTNPSNNSFVGYCRVYYYKYSSDTEINTSHILFFDVFNTSDCVQLLNNQTVDLNAGTYLLIAVVSQTQSSQSITAYIDYSENEIIKYQDKYVGGVRINEIKSCDGVNPANDIIKTYSYKRNYLIPPLTDEPTGYNRSSAELFSDPFHSNYSYAYIDRCSKKLNVSSFLIDPLGEPLRNEGSHIGYSEVTEISKGKMAGIRILKYQNGYNSEQRSLVLNETSYDSQLNPVKSILNTYTGPYMLQANYYQKIFKMIYAQKTCASTSSGNYCSTTYQFADRSSVAYTSSWIGIRETTEKTYNWITNNHLENTTQYFYDGAERGKHSFLTQKINFKSDNNQMIEKMKYPLDFETPTNNIIDTLISRNIINNPIEQQTFANMNITTSYYNKFVKHSSGFINISDTYECDFYKYTNQNNHNGLDGYGNLSPNNFYKKMLSFEYDMYGNLITQTKTDILSTSYLWGYGRTLPVVQIQNITYTGIPTSISNNVFLHVFSTTGKYSDIQNDIKYLKTELATIINNPNYMVSLYTYKPLVGTTSMTDPRGVTTYYEYDITNRLKQTYIIENGEKKILQKYDYHYANQQ